MTNTAATTRHPIAVVGAGAAGLMAAIFAAGNESPVILLERTSDGGRKILISGGGRCNILPSQHEPHRFVTASSPHSLRNILRSWPLEDQRAFFEQELALSLVMEPETGKLFPASNKARDVRDGLVRTAKAAGVRFRSDARVVDVARPETAGGPWNVVLERGEPLPVSALILATGGLSVPKTGSDGGGLGIAERLGHTINPTYPALTPLLSDPPRHAHLAGVSLRVSIHGSGPSRKFATSGGFLFTHRGYSGPTALDASHLFTRTSIGEAAHPIIVQWTELDRPTWDARLQHDAGNVLTTIGRQLPARLAEQLLSECAIPLKRSIAQLTRGERHKLLTALTAYELPISGDEGYKKAEVTGGGVPLQEIDPRTMESRIHPRLFLCGEMLDAFGPIGGYNFQWAWATGRAAGLGAGGCAPGRQESH